jgi:hypothetical protein
MAIVTDDVEVLVDFTSDKELLKKQLETLKMSALSGSIGASEQYDALLASLSELFGREDVRPIIIFQTDGDQLEALNGSDGRSADPYWPAPKIQPAGYFDGDRKDPNHRLLGDFGYPVRRRAGS